MFRSREIQLLKDMLARERAERMDLMLLMQSEREAHRKELSELQSRLAGLIESLIKPRPAAVPTSATAQYPLPQYPGFRPQTEPDRNKIPMKQAK